MTASNNPEAPAHAESDLWDALHNMEREIAQRDAYDLSATDVRDLFRECRDTLDELEAGITGQEKGE